MSDFPAAVLVPSLDAQYADLGLDPFPFQVVGQSFTPEGARFVQVFTGSGYQWLAPSQYEEVPPPATTCGECAPDGEPVVADTSHCEQCGQRVTS